LPAGGRWYQHGTSRDTLPGMLRVYLGHGAWGTPEAMAPWVDGLRSRGIEAHAVALPRGRAERGIAPFAAQLPDAPGVVVGGHSLGGRVATLIAAGGPAVPERRHPVAGVLGLSYPLHRPSDPVT
jgi:pimeloyl-ACP methyl ester carboxylesterase